MLILLRIPRLGIACGASSRLGGVAHDFTNWLTVTFNAEYNQSIAEEHNVPSQRYTELSLPATFILPHDWAISTGLQGNDQF